jgi:hypothetical protein
MFMCFAVFAVCGDTCNSHPTPLSADYNWHHHGIPNCLTATVDEAGGPSHIIGIALDGFPIYGGRYLNGNIVDVSQLDSCNGITSATPEFPNGAYHYVLPLNVTGKQSSLNCYSGTVTETQMALARALACTIRLARTALPPAPPRVPMWRPIRPVRYAKPTLAAVN